MASRLPGSLCRAEVRRSFDNAQQPETKSVIEQPRYAYKHVPGIEEIEYPAPVVVRNTFIDTLGSQPASWVDTFKERQIQSCPNSYIMQASEDTFKIGSPYDCSRSTSPGQSTLEEDNDCDHHPAYVRLPTTPRDLFTVKNTFIQVGSVGQPTSMDGFFEERQIQSCPASGIGAPPGLEIQDVIDDADSLRAARQSVAARELSLVAAISAAASAPKPRQVDDCKLSQAIRRITTVSQEQDLREAFDAIDRNGDGMISRSEFNAAFGIAAEPLMQHPRMAAPRDSCLPPPPCVAAPALEELQIRDLDAIPPPPSHSAKEQSASLSLEEALAAPQRLVLGSPYLPTIGSEAHDGLGSCKPCAFVFTKGCVSGVQCPFCHICPPGELKRRQKEKRASQRSMRIGNGMSDRSLA